MMPLLIESALRSLLAAGAVWTGLRAFRVSNVLAQKAAWCLVLAAAAAMPLLLQLPALPIDSALRLRAPWVEPVRQTGVDPTSETLRAMPEAQGMSRLKDAESTTGEPFSGSSIAPSVSTDGMGSIALAKPAARVPLGARLAAFARRSPATLAALGYGVVLVFLLLRVLHGGVGAWLLWINALPLELEGAADLRVRCSREIASPVTIGSGVLLPDDFSLWPEEKLQIVLAHERSHVRQGDFYLQLAASLYAAVFWFSPLGWWLKRKLSDLGEAIGDRAGLACAESSASYAQILVEFAAQPRPAFNPGVAMASPSNLSHRIERLLNESTFRQAFHGTRGRIALALVLVPAALFAATAMIRVEAAQTAPAAPADSAAPAAAQAPAALIAPVTTAPAAPEPVIGSTPASPAAPAPEPSAVPAPPAPPAPSYFGEIHDSADEAAAARQSAQDRTTRYRKGYSYTYSNNGDSYALILDSTGKITFSGDWNKATQETVDKARKLAREKFLLFSHDGKSWFLDDPATIAQIEQMYLPMKDLSLQQEKLAKVQEELGRKQAEMAVKQRAASVPAPDIAKEMAQLQAALSKLQAKKQGLLNQDDLNELEGRIGDLEGKIGSIEGAMGAEQGRIGDLEGKLGAEEGKLGAEEGRLGAEEGRLSQEIDRKVKAIIDQALKDLKAHPVQ